jgi:hypothetical protein
LLILLSGEHLIAQTQTRVQVDSEAAFSAVVRRCYRTTSE